MIATSTVAGAGIVNTARGKAFMTPVANRTYGMKGMKAFTIKGTFKISERRWQAFSIEVASADEEAAREKLLTILGSRHKVPRRLVRIDTVTQLANADITDPVVKHQVGADA
ncbi:MAG: hypothetical protein KIY09_05485 [Thermoplasmata archaeon]|nr:hypothetical protein [Candidatus Sysuiplasma acidicola]MDH2906114.1 50S ribosomal protein L18Ae [Methanomassiliicoccales archaeon]